MREQSDFQNQGEENYVSSSLERSNDLLRMQPTKGDLTGKEPREHIYFFLVSSWGSPLAKPSHKPEGIAVFWCNTNMSASLKQRAGLRRASVSGGENRSKQNTSGTVLCSSFKLFYASLECGIFLAPVNKYL